MKKIFSLILSFCLVLTLAGCGEDGTSDITKEDVDKVVEEAKDGFIDAFNTLKGKLGELNDTYGPEVKDKVTDVLSTLKDKVTETIENIDWDEVKTKTIEGAKTAKEVSISIKDNLSEQFDIVSANVKKFIDEEVSDETKEKITTGVNNILEDMANQANQAKADFNDSEVADGIRVGFKNLMDKYEELTVEFTKFKEDFKDEHLNPEALMEAYLKFAKDYSDTTNEIDKIDESKLSEEEVSYYKQVMAKIEELLASSK